jgi:hypothetical protein
MDFRKFRILPVAAIALSMMMVPVAMAGAREDGMPDNDNPPGHEQPTPPDKTPNPTPPSPPSPPSTGGGGNSHEYGSTSIVCRIGNRSVYVASFRQCKELKYALGYGEGRGGGSVVVGGGYVRGGGHATGYVYGGEGYGYNQQQRIIRYVARPSRAARMQAEKRARRSGHGYGDGGMVGYGNGVMVGGYGNNVVINGNVYAGQQIVVKKKRKSKRGRRVVYQQPIYDNGYGYDYQGPVMYKDGGY